MPIDDDFAIEQSEANVTLENMKISDEVRDLVARGRLGEFNTTDIINIIVNG